MHERIKNAIIWFTGVYLSLTAEKFEEDELLGMVAEKYENAVKNVRIPVKLINSEEEMKKKLRVLRERRRDAEHAPTY